MIEGNFAISENREIAPGMMKMVLEGSVPEETKPGQFVNILLPERFLRRPISISDVIPGADGRLALIYKVVGKGTEDMAGMKEGTCLDLLLPLGNGYDLNAPMGDNLLLVGGGSGIPPLYLLAKKLLSMGKRVTVVMGFNKKEEIYYQEEFSALGCRVVVTTVDGSYGTKGFVTDGIKDAGDSYTYYFACGPEPMLKALYQSLDFHGQMSFEERMGCGFGACMGCSIKLKNETKRICKDGPVFKKEEIIPWTD
ncbi:MAG: dihydroorotate dehydrogenase electron transfer subunit [Firmicutes bacterium]|nr:dihydroorotate dehydrogenase electron transfer subunit [Bacillota bacterium]